MTSITSGPAGGRALLAGVWTDAPTTVATSYTVQTSDAGKQRRQDGTHRQCQSETLLELLGKLQ